MLETQHHACTVRYILLYWLIRASRLASDGGENTDHPLFTMRNDDKHISLESLHYCYNEHSRAVPSQSSPCPIPSITSRVGTACIRKRVKLLLNWPIKPHRSETTPKLSYPFNQKTFLKQLYCSWCRVKSPIKNNQAVRRPIKMFPLNNF